MTRASTSAANSGFLLVALVLMLHSVVGELTPRHARHHLFARNFGDVNCFTKIEPNNMGYKARCEAGSDSKHTCFTHWAGDLTDAEACPVQIYDMRKRLMIKDKTMKDFTMQESTDTFEIRYPNLGGVSFTVSNNDPSTGCKDIIIRRGDNPLWRIWVSDEDGDGRDIDTLNYKWSTKRLCSKWIHIHVKRDGRLF
ncbi:related to Mig1 protein [Ustilago bromivora]|uniref:Related to Mig1 protein n=1 Tax=Ustilago bromivora TaxID=307758 RepID=A0A1K0FXK5_9BASI|nr:related to Mig1 protein [Ustilago bromivora]SYW81079.1 related to Mig1 protein, induced during biotrophic phase [Ustilago bromivora]